MTGYTQTYYTAATMLNSIFYFHKMSYKNNQSASETGKIILVQEHFKLILWRPIYVNEFDKIYVKSTVLF